MVEEFFAFARERHSIYLRRQKGSPWPWTSDPILQKYKFTNVFRELDRTTVWFHENVRNALRDQPEVLLATVVFRWFNRIETAEVIFKQLLFSGETPWDHFLKTGEAWPMRSCLASAYPDGPYVTGAYMIRSPTGMSKLDGMLHLCSEFWKTDWRAEADCLINGWGETESLTMEGFTEWLKEIPGQGPFLAYEIACDLRYTALLEKALDIMTWANPGPGAQRGLNRLHGRLHPKPRKPSKKWASSGGKNPDRANEEMRYLLDLSQREHYWPQSWQPWEMRTVEHTLCEFDKFQRVKLGEGEPKSLYRRTAP